MPPKSPWSQPACSDTHEAAVSNPCRKDNHRAITVAGSSCSGPGLLEVQGPNVRCVWSPDRAPELLEPCLTWQPTERAVAEPGDDPEPRSGTTAGLQVGPRPAPQVPGTWTGPGTWGQSPRTAKPSRRSVWNDTGSQGNRARVPDSAMKERRLRAREERLSLVVWKRPLTTLHYFLLEALIEAREWTLK